MSNRRKEEAWGESPRGPLHTAFGFSFFRPFALCPVRWSLPSLNANSFRKCLRSCELSSIQPAIQWPEPWFEPIEIGGSSTEPAADKKGLELRRRTGAEKRSAPLAASR